MIKSVDAICAKLEQQQQLVQADSSPSKTEQFNSRSSVNKRKNFQPQGLNRQSNQQAFKKGFSIVNADDDDRGSLQDFPINVAIPFMIPSVEENQQSDQSRVIVDNRCRAVTKAINLANPSFEHYIISGSARNNCHVENCQLSTNNGEHFHCHQCAFRIFTKKEEMLSHYKWHRKREESLAHGFLRYSASDSCKDYFSACIYDFKQTHYHCLEPICDKVYTSTSDVQMHANSHRKTARIVREGFQRYKVSEDCKLANCPFRDVRLRTTHFHCLRPGCSHSFKNKSDITKFCMDSDRHKAYHLRESKLKKDEFKNFMKVERCPSDCDFVAHSTSQMYPNKRKHDKQTKNHRKRKFSILAANTSAFEPPQLPFSMNPLITPSSLAAFMQNLQNSASIITPNFMSHLSKRKFSTKSDKVQDGERQSISAARKQNASECDNDKSEPHPINFNMLQSSLNLIGKLEDDESAAKVPDAWKEHVIRFTVNDPCLSLRPLVRKDHYHCSSDDNCHMTLQNEEEIREHVCQHQLLRMVAGNYTFMGKDCKYDCRLDMEHYHCNVPTCLETILGTEPIFRRLEHFKVHAFLGTFRYPKQQMTPKMLSTNKRGRPRTVSSPPTSKSPPLSAISSWRQSKIIDTGGKTLNVYPMLFKPKFQGFATYSNEKPCPDPDCQYRDSLHFHCPTLRCFYSTINPESLQSHCDEFHKNSEIAEGFACFFSGCHCKFPKCAYNEQTRHFHCIHQGCQQSFLKTDQLSLHKHQDETLISNDSKAIVKTTGVYFPTNTGQSTAIAPNSTAFYTVDQHCGRPFCKLKRRLHYHCNKCSQGFSNVDRLLPHLHKHGISIDSSEATATLINAPHCNKSQQESQSMNVPAEEEGPRKIKFHVFLPESLKFTTEEEMTGKGANVQQQQQQQQQQQLQQQQQQQQQLPMKKFKFIDCTQETVDAVNRGEFGQYPRANIHSTNRCSFGDFGRFTGKNDCGVPTCSMSNQSLHYHCLKSGCGVPLSDKKQLEAHNCLHRQKSQTSLTTSMLLACNCHQHAGLNAVHFHCPKCEFVANETGKTLLHIRQHEKQDALLASGFEKIISNGTNSESIPFVCPKNTQCPHVAGVHFHCVDCPHVAFNQLQMTTHKLAVHPILELVSR